ncbi:hypothetical protein [Pseudomonas sp. GR 6-02]|uniref:hypothetical protein n=1 Tax=Pseudomonas sp. GR 6-02 TaxID=1659194 RepID=UPI0007E3E58C|nr:hypothetical protein [Pseudomonas sp. GR 6-02]
MRNFVFCLFMVLCASCSSKHGRPIATLHYEKVETSPSGNSYQIRFTSDTELLGLFKSKIGEGLVCALEDDLDFSVGHYIKRSGRGTVEFVKDSSGEHYISMILFREAEELQGKETILTGQALREILDKREFMLCTFRVHTTRYKTYFSNVMRVPTADLLKAAAKE